MSEDNVPRERRPVESSIPPLDRTFQLSEKQINFLLHAIRDVNPVAADAEAQVRNRVLEIQSRAYEVYPYPCIRTLRHVSPLMSENDAFAHILRAGQSAGQANSPLLLDIGCCMGTDLRHLVQSGYPSKSVIGCDLRRDFIDLGHALYADRDTCSIPFLVGDIFDVTPHPFPQMADKVGPSPKDVRSLNELRGRVKYIYAGALFHLFDEETQETIARCLATLLDVTKESGPAVVFGRHVTKAEEGDFSDMLWRSRGRYAHSPESWTELWNRELSAGDMPVRVNTEWSLDSRRTWYGPSPIPGTKTMAWSVWVG